ncbi:hypothetical protein [Bradyrhizobium genosp. A]|uniref:hypothetical protein n=1 Tax=Bradyrhizobium genosp. A TaxID=83626 RepID=UPI003CF383CA
MRDMLQTICGLGHFPTGSTACIFSAPVDYIDRIQEGASPNDLPIQAPAVTS